MKDQTIQVRVVAMDRRPKRLLPTRRAQLSLMTALMATITLSLMAWQRRARGLQSFPGPSMDKNVQGYSLKSRLLSKVNFPSLKARSETEQESSTPDTRYRKIDRTGVPEYLTTIRQDWRVTLRNFMDSSEPEMFSARKIREHFHSDMNNVQGTCMLVTIKNGNVTFTEKYEPNRHSRASSVKYILNRIIEQKGASLPGATFMVMLTDGHRPHVATFGSARHWKSWNRMIPVPLGNSRGSNLEWGTQFEGWDAYIDNTVVRSHSNYSWSSKAGKAVFRGSLCMQTYRLGSCNSENGGRCVRASKWNEVNRGVLYETTKGHPELFDVGFTQHKPKIGAPGSQFNGAPPAGKSMDFRDFQKYKYILNVGSNQDWAERLRSLLYMNSAVIIHQAETQEFFTPLLKPWVHFIPTDLHFRDLVKNVKWASEHDQEVQQIVRNQNAFADRYINERSMQQYWEVAIKEFSERQANVAGFGRGSVH